LGGWTQLPNKQPFGGGQKLSAQKEGRKHGVLSQYHVSGQRKRGFILGGGGAGNSHRNVNEVVHVMDREKRRRGEGR